ncbi:hypothetical protein ONZ51_g6566 [Trametes cubensis]|uniref:Uncharacterized protein n=1 Tax=Trametes cubensis TaxID=1111947 RepID=A0AAD7TUG3_9APHY|nr:hypothetical protein ONZ51_g6566 [Trametes cubensis]
MGNSASSGRGHHEEMVDFGYLTPQGIYTGPRDWNQAVVTQLIIDRKLAPFYRPLEDYDESWDDDQILAARKELPDTEGGDSSRAESINSTATSRGHQKRPSAAKEPARHPEAAIYRGAVECPICFLIKRADPTTTHLVSEPASCPYCVQENFGVVYTPPPWRAGLGSEGATPPSWPDSPKATSQQSLDAAVNPSMKRRRKSFGANDPEVVTVDQIHPDWEAKLAAVRAAVARRANRRIIMRQVGDRLIPVGVTSGRVHALPAEEGGAETAEGSSDRGSRRSRRRQQNQELNQFLGTMGLAGQDLEELMVMEAMRLSLIEHEAQQRRQQEEEAKKKREEAAALGNTDGASGNAVAGSTESASPSRPSEESTPRSLRPTNDLPPVQPVTPTPNTPAVSASPVSSGPVSPPEQSVQQSGRSSPAPQQEAVNVTLSGDSAANATGTLDSEHGQSDPIAAVEPVSIPPETAGDGSSSNTAISTGNVVASDVPAISEPSSSGQEADAQASPSPLNRPPSFSSSLAQSSYDVLPSSPESTISHKPWLESAAATSDVIVDGDSSTTVAN